jgi:hypothetical protein
LAKRCELREHEIRSIIRYAIVHHRVFLEPRDGFVAHSTASKLLAENANNIQEMVGLTVEEWAPAYNKVSNRYEYQAIRNIDTTMIDSRCDAQISRPKTK